MRERGDLIVLHEPFMYHYYLTVSERLFPDFAPDPGHPRTYTDIREMIQCTAGTKPVFFKDMAYYVQETLSKDSEFANQMTHAFLVRDPTEAAVSYAKLDPDFSQTELGHEAQYLLYRALVALGHRPLVITADQLRSDTQDTLRRYWNHVGLDFAGHAFCWDSKVPDGWQSVEGWHRDVLQSGTIHKAEPRPTDQQLAQLGAQFADYAAYHAPFYAKLRDIARKQAHQK